MLLIFIVFFIYLFVYLFILIILIVIVIVLFFLFFFGGGILKCTEVCFNYKRGELAFQLNGFGTFSLRLWNARWQLQTYQVLSLFRRSEHAHITENNGFTL